MAKRCPVLVVDDDPSIRSMVCVGLGRAGWEVTAVESGSECLARARAGFQGLLLLDVVMPGMDGWQTLRELVKEGLERGVCVCMLTGVRDPGPAAEGLEEWVLDYVVKPVDFELLLSVVERAAEYLNPD